MNGALLSQLLLNKKKEAKFNHTGKRKSISNYPRPRPATYPGGPSFPIKFLAFALKNILLGLSQTRRNQRCSQNEEQVWSHNSKKRKKKERKGDLGFLGGTNLLPPESLR
jgi:hypothetical protein